MPRIILDVSDDVYNAFQDRKGELRKELKRPKITNEEVLYALLGKTNLVTAVSKVTKKPEEEKKPDFWQKFQAREGAATQPGVPPQ